MEATTPGTKDVMPQNASGVDLAGPIRQAQGLANQFLKLLPNLVLAAVVLAVAYLIGKYVARLVRALAGRAGQGPGVGLLLGRIATYVVVTFGILVAVSTVFPSFTANSLVQTLGIGGVAVGFAFKDIFQNFLAGVIILISRPFRIGDAIAVKGYEGTVEDIQTRATVVRTYDSQRIVIPNSTIFTEEVRVITAYDARRIEIQVGIGYGDDIPTAKAAILGAIQGVEGVEERPAPDVLTMEFGDSAMILRMRYWVAPDGRNALAVRDEVLTKVKAALDAAGVEIPYPTQTVAPPRPSAKSPGDVS